MTDHSERNNHPSRRKLLVVATAGTVAVAAAAAGVLVTNRRGLSKYTEIIRTTWRNGDIVEGSWTAKQRELVRYATLAANSHNTQPWRFQILDRSVMVLPDTGRRLPAVDPDDHHLFASLGCAVENMVEAAPSLGLRAVPTYDVRAQGIRVDLEPAPHATTDLFNAVIHRQSTRTVYDGRPVPPAHLTLLQAAGTAPTVRMLLFTERKEREQILSYLIAGNDAQMKDMAFVKELKSWIRFSYEDALSTRDGLFAKSSGSPVLPSFVGP
ncbi:MAG: Tat pathway signal protein, partial [Deltaproteobacteria bacterium]|nr:Tat pathway signal protein [Nannocystaceae bacterium]